MRLLVVEDDPDLNRQLTTALTDAGYVVDTVADGEEGHFLGDTEPYDAVILDLGLPVIDGVTVLGKVAPVGAQDAGSHPDGARPLERQGGRFRRRRRRLRVQAVSHGRGPGAGAGALAPQRRARDERYQLRAR
jgi:hypothetical protein